jgi:hypothetical protein
VNLRSTILALGAAALFVSILYAAVLAHLFGIGGLHAGYRARDGDLLLTRIARSAQPIIGALDRYEAIHGVFPNSASAGDVSALASSFPLSMKVVRQGGWLAFETGGPSPWTYYLLGSDGRSYTLSTKLGWDPRLAYRRNPGGGQWIFEPGDGSDENVIDLRP